jgi:hypothetical protein
MIKQHITALGQLLTQLIKALDNNCRIDVAFDQIWPQVVVPFQKTSDIQASTMACRRLLKGGASRLLRVRQRRL